jgi:hypothetical protein
MKVKQGSIQGKGGVDSTQHMLHCMSQYNNGTLRIKDGAHVVWARTSGQSSTEWGSKQGQRGIMKGQAEAARPESRLTKGNNR